MNSIIIIILFLFWFLRTARAVFFNIWLWQIKEYRLDRFLDFLKTKSGKKILFNKLLFFKIILVFGFLFSSAALPFIFNLTYAFNLLTTAVFIPAILLTLYFLESVKIFKDFYQKKIKKPIFTKKATLILAFNSLIFISMPIFLLAKIQSDKIIYDFPPLIRFCSGLLAIDIFTPIIISLIILSFQPLSIFLKKRIIQKAKEKIAKYSNLIVIGITGSYGKTSAKEFLATILSEKFNNANVLKTVKANTDIGVAKTVLNELNSKHKIFIVEMGAYKIGEIKAICDIVKPKIGILTGINEQHMALFGSLENTVKAKFELIEALPEHGLAVINSKLKTQKHALESHRGSKPQLKIQNFKFFSISEKIPLTPFKKGENQNDIYASDIKVEKNKIKFKVISGEDSENFEVNLIGSQNVSNILACAGVAEYLGMSLKEISDAAKKIQPIAKTMKNYPGIKNTVLIDDTYNSNPAGVMAALDYLEKSWLHSGDSPVEPLAQDENCTSAPQPCLPDRQAFGTMELSNNSGRKIILFPGIIELGSASKKVHHSLGKKMSEVCDLIIITKKDFADYIENHSVPPERNNQFITQENPEKVYQYLKNYLKPNDIVLFESRGMESVLEKLKEK